jgi:adenylate cyclase
MSKQCNSPSEPTITFPRRSALNPHQLPVRKKMATFFSAKVGGMKGIARKRLAAVVISTIVFSIASMIVAHALDLATGYMLIGLPLLGLCISSFEVFYFQANRGRWLREMHPLKSNAIYILILTGLFLVVQHANYAIRGRWDELTSVYERYPVVIPVLLGISLLAVMVLRIINFVGGRTIFYLLVGKYHRPIRERKIFLFLDINGSTKLVESLGPEKTNQLFGKFMFNASKPIADHGGEIYRYQGDGFIATWDWKADERVNGILEAVDDLYATVAHERPEYERRFGVCPDFRIGIHGGDVIVCEEGDIRRNIAFYGDAINIAARMETKAKEVGMDCILTSDIATLFDDPEGRLVDLGKENVRGIDRDIAIYGLERLTAS